MKKAQSQIITTVLIILLVLAAIVIVWQVVRSVIDAGGTQIGSAEDCFGIAMEVEANSARPGEFIIRRSAGGPELLNNPTVIIIVDGTTDTTASGALTANFKTPLTSESVAISGNPGIVEAALKLSNGEVCPIAGKWEDDGSSPSGASCDATHCSLCTTEPACTTATCMWDAGPDLVIGTADDIGCM